MSESRDTEDVKTEQVLFGRFMLPDQSEHACSVVGLSVKGAEIRAAHLPTYGMPLIAYLEHFGRIEGIAKEATVNGFRLEFALTGARRERFLSRQAWLGTKHAGAAQDVRLYNRRQLTGARSRVVLSDGRDYPCEIIDVSLTGAAVTSTVLPALGSKVYLGKMLGSVVRYLDNGFALEFLTAFGSDFLADLVVDEPRGDNSLS